MDRMQEMICVVSTLLVLTTFNILPVNGDVICPWCSPRLQENLLNCMYMEMVAQPALFNVPLPTIDDIKWRLASESDAMSYMPYVGKKIAMDEKYVNEMADLIKQNNFQNNPVVINAVSGVAGKCYSSVTGYSADVVTQEVKNLVQDNIRKSTSRQGGDPNPVLNSGMPYSANQNQPSNFQQPNPVPPPFPPDETSYTPNSANNLPFQGQLPGNNNGYENNPGLQENKPLGSGPLNRPGSPPANSFDNTASYNPPGSPQANPFNPPGSPPANSFDNTSPFNSPWSPPVNSFDKAGPFNPAESPRTNPFKPPASAPGSPLDNTAPFDSSGLPPSKSYDNTAPLNPPASPAFNPSNNPNFVNNAPGPSKSGVSDDYDRQKQAGSDLSRNQAPSDGSSGTPIQNYDVSPNNKKSSDSAVLVSTRSPSISTPPKNSKLSDSDSSIDSNGTTTSPSTDASQTKTAGKKKTDEEPCDEKFKIALYDTLINDSVFQSFFGKHPVSETKPAVPKIMKRVFEKYGISNQYPEFSSYWKFESKTLNKDSTTKDWDEVISKCCKVIFSRHNLLNGDCAEIGRTIADYFLGTVPGDSPASSTFNPNKNDGSLQTSTESTTNPPTQESSSVSKPTTSVSLENNPDSNNSTNSGSLSFPDVHSKLKNMFKDNGSDKQDNDDVPFSKMLAAFEAQQNMEKLHRAAESCKTPSGFDFDKFFEAMSNVTDSIQRNHPDWSRDECQKETYTETIAVLTKELSDTTASSNDNTQNQSSSNQSDSDVNLSNSQNSDSGTQSAGPNDYDLSSEDYPGSSDYRNTFSQPNSQNFPSQNYPVILPASMNTQPNQQHPYPNYDYKAPVIPNGNSPNFQQEHYPDYDYNAPVITNDNSQNFKQQPYPNYDYKASVIPNGNPPNFQQELYPDYDYNAPVIANDNSQNFEQQPYPNYDYKAPVIPNGNSPNFQQELYPDYDYIAPVKQNSDSPNFQQQPTPNYDYKAPVIPNGNSPNFQQQPYSDYEYNAPVIPNSNSPNFQQQPLPNYDYNTPVIPNSNSQNIQQQAYPNYDYNTPVIPDSNSQNFQQQPSQNSRYIDNGPAIPKW